MSLTSSVILLWAGGIIFYSSCIHWRKNPWCMGFLAGIGISIIFTTIILLSLS